MIGSADLWGHTGRTKRYVIDMLRDSPIASVLANELKTSDLISHCRMRRDTGAGCETVYHDIAYLRNIMKKALPVF